MTSFAVVTATVGRPELERAIKSVQAQQHPCRHYVFVDGAQYTDAVRPLQEKYPEVVFVFLPFNTGAGGWYNSHILAASSCLLKEDVICFLDDDNWYEPEHIATFARLFEARPDLGYAYALRNYRDEDGSFLCEDHYESLGFYETRLNELRFSFEFSGQIFSCVHTKHSKLMVDVNCYALPRATAVKIARYWLEYGFGNDEHVFNALLDGNFTGACSGCYTVNYCINWETFDVPLYELEMPPGWTDQNLRNICRGRLKEQNRQHRILMRKLEGRLPWLDNRNLSLGLPPETPTETTRPEEDMAQYFEIKAYAD